MDLATLGSIGEFVSGLGVIASLIYVAFQVRQNTSALRTASRQEVTSGYRDTIRLNFQAKEMAYANGLDRYPDIPFDERRAFSLLLTDHALHTQSACTLYESGQLEEDTYRAYLNWFACQIATPGGKVWWNEVGRPFFTKDMVREVDEFMAMNEFPDIRKLPTFRCEQ